MAEPEVGQRYKLLADYGNQEYDPVGLRHGYPAGTVGTVRELVPAHVPGAHNMEEDSVVLEITDTALSIGPDGKLAKTELVRATAFAAAAFGGDSPLFEQVAE